jgi:hypothetical protein
LKSKTISPFAASTLVVSTHIQLLPLHWNIAAMASLFLGVVRRALQAEPSPHSLFILLQLADPELTFQGIRLKADRDRLIKQLRLAVHPDRQDSKDDATRVFQQMTTFCDRCAHFDFSSGGSATSGETSHPTLDNKFNVEEHWPSVAKNMKTFTHINYMAKARSWCYNMRGHIVHHALTGREAGAVYNANDGGSYFHKLPAGNSIDSVKRELKWSGPVLSTSFKPSGAVAWKHGLAQGVARDAAIFGWQMKHGTGEVWLVEVAKKILEVPMGECSLLDEVRIPTDDICNMEWQHTPTYPYLERDFSGQADWFTFTTCNVNFSSGQAASLWELLGGEELCASKILGEKKRIEVCKTGMKAMSRRAEITDFVVKRDKPGAVTLRIQFL